MQAVNFSQPAACSLLARGCVDNPNRVRELSKRCGPLASLRALRALRAGPGGPGEAAAMSKPKNAVNEFDNDA